MIITYSFKNYKYGDYERYNLEVDYRELEKALIKILCDQAKSVNGKAYSEEGATQMALLVVNTVDCEEELAPYFEEELEGYFYNKAYSEWEEQNADYEEDRRWGW